MTKLYYTCSIQAAYMAKEFGVRYREAIKSLRDNEFIDIWNNIAPADIMDLEWAPSLGKFYIHPDSLPIFEPQKGDLVAIDGWHHVAITCETYAKMGRLYGKRAHFIELECIADFSCPKQTACWLENEAIIQRNDKPFFWPLAEEE